MKKSAAATFATETRQKSKSGIEYFAKRIRSLRAAKSNTATTKDGDILRVGDDGWKVGSHVEDGSNPNSEVSVPMAAGKYVTKDGREIIIGPGGVITSIKQVN